MKFNRPNLLPIIVCILFSFTCLFISNTGYSQGKRKADNLVITNFDKQGNQTIVTAP